MTFDEILTQVLDLLQRERRLSYRAIKVRFGLDDDHLEALKDEIIEAKQLAVDERGRVLVWTGAPASSPPPAATPTSARVPVAAIPTHLAEKILTTRHALEGERKQVTVLFADLKDSTELIRGLDPEAAPHTLALDALPGVGYSVVTSPSRTAVPHGRARPAVPCAGHRRPPGLRMSIGHQCAPPGAVASIARGVVARVKALLRAYSHSRSRICSWRSIPDALHTLSAPDT